MGPRLTQGRSSSDTPSVEHRATRASPWRSAPGIGACLVLGWLAFVRGTKIPVLWLVDLGFHELGHMLSEPLPEGLTAAMGSVTQICVPLGLALLFLLHRRDPLAAGVCLAWAATSAVDVSLYIADAPYERLQLIGGEHDWASLLGPEHLDALAAAHTIAAAVRGLAVILLIAGIALCLSDLALTPGTLRRPLRAREIWR